MVDFRFCTLILLAGSAAQGCPSVSFQAGYSESLTPTSASHVVLVKQPDNSYTDYEATDRSPYTVLGTTPQFEKQLTACPPAPAAAPVGVVNVEAMARTNSGTYLFASYPNNLDVAEFDANLNLISEAQYNIPPEGGIPTLADVMGMETSISSSRTRRPTSKARRLWFYSVTAARVFSRLSRMKSPIQASPDRSRLGM